MAKLSDSVAPEVHTISRESALTRSATCCLACSTASSAFQPKMCEREAGFPKLPSRVRHSVITFTTRGSTGVVAE